MKFVFQHICWRIIQDKSLTPFLRPAFTPGTYLHPGIPMREKQIEYDCVRIFFTSKFFLWINVSRPNTEFENGFWHLQYYCFNSHRFFRWNQSKMKNIFIRAYILTIATLLLKASLIKGWQFTDDATGQTCIVVQFIARLKIKYPTEGLISLCLDSKKKTILNKASLLALKHHKQFPC